MAKIKILWILAAVAGFLITDNATAQCQPRTSRFLPLQCNVGFRFSFSMRPIQAQTQLSPWYSYFPYEEYFNAPPPLGQQYPNWPNPFPPAAAPVNADQIGGYRPNAPRPALPVHRVSYQHYYYPAPAYWYGR